jgi:hypothetical protein
MMSVRVSSLLALSGALTLGSCSTAPVQEVPSPKAQRELANALAGRTPGPAVRCLPNYRSNGMQVVDDNNILFRDGRTIYLQRPRGGCSGLNNGMTLVTRQFGTSQLCDGDINHTVDLLSGMQGGACVFGPFVPYTKPKG